MADLRSTLAAYGKRRVAFSAVALAVLALFLSQSWSNYVFVVAGWFENGLGLIAADQGHHRLHEAHRLHNIAISLMTWPFLFGMLAQFRSPTSHVTGMLMALSVWLAGLLVVALTGVVPMLIIVAVIGVPTLLAALLHPAGRELLTTFDLARVNRLLLVMVVVAAVPLLAYAAHETDLQTGAVEPAGHDHAEGEHAEIHDEHVGGGHYARMAWVAVAIVGTGLLASFRQPGWWLGAWAVGLMTVALGVAGVLAPEAASNPGTLWNLGAIAWGVGFVGVAELTQTTESPTPLGIWRGGHPSAG